jgi:hypothetical protein
MRWIILLLLAGLSTSVASTQDLSKLADSIRIANKIPEMGYAVVSSAEILAL